MTGQIVQAPSLTDQQRAKLARLQNRATRYEVAAAHLDGRRVLLCYTGRHTRRSIDAIIRDHRDELVAFLGPVPLAEDGARGYRTGTGTIRFTGRTQRQAIMEGELPFIGAAPAGERAA